MKRLHMRKKRLWLARIILYYIGCIQPMSHSEVKDDYNDIYSLINPNPSMDIFQYPINAGSNFNFTDHT